MKTYLLASITSLGLVALIGCSDDDSHMTRTHTSAMMSSDSKDMTGSTMTPAPAMDETPATNSVDSANQGYPAIHSNGQGGGGL